MKQIFIIVILFTIAIIVTSPVSAISNSFQGWDNLSFSLTVTNAKSTQPYILAPGSDGDITVYQSTFTSCLDTTAGSNIISQGGAPFTYAAWDSYLFQGGGMWNNGAELAELYDASGNSLGSYVTNYHNWNPQGWSATGRNEMKMIGMAPTFFYNGVLVGSMPVIAVNPSYIRISPWSQSPGCSGGTATSYTDNVLVGGSDHHVIGSLPSNWSLIRDFLNSAATGVYAGNATGLAWVLKNSNTFYIDADTDSQDGIDTETLLIKNVQTGVTVNSTVIDSTIPRHQIAYNLTQFLAPGTSVVPDGLYSVGYEGSTVLGYFNLISNGGWIQFDRSTYNIGDTGAMSWYLSQSYIDLTNYDYTYKIVDSAGSLKASGVTATTSTDTSGTVAINFNSATYSQGVYYAEMIATNKLTHQENLMGYSAITITDYLNFYGHAYNAQTCAVLSGAQLNFTQGSTVNKYVTTADGNYSTTGYLTGAALTFNASKSGYLPYGYTINPLGARNVSLDFALIPSPTNTTGIAIGGVARSTTYGQLVPGATVYVWNITTGEFHTRTTNACGYYYCDDGSLCSLASQRAYNVQGNATGYAASAIYGVTTL